VLNRCQCSSIAFFRTEKMGLCVKCLLPYRLNLVSWQVWSMIAAEKSCRGLAAGTVAAVVFCDFSW